MEANKSEEILILLAKCKYWEGMYDAVKRDYDDLLEKVIMRDEEYPYEEV